MGGNRKRRSQERSEGSDPENPSSPPVAPSAGVDLQALRNLFREEIGPLRESIEGARAEISGVKTEVSAIKADVGALSGRVSALEQSHSSSSSAPRGAAAPAPAFASPRSPASAADPARAPPPAAPPRQASPVQHRAPSLADSGSRDHPLRVEFTNCHAWERRMEEAFDEAGALAFLNQVTAALPPRLRQLLLPEREQARRNSRALVFVPVLHVKPGQTVEDRGSLLEALRTALSTGAFDRNGRRPPRPLGTPPRPEAF